MDGCRKLVVLGTIFAGRGGNLEYNYFSISRVMIGGMGEGMNTYVLVTLIGKTQNLFFLL